MTNITKTLSEEHKHIIAVAQALQKECSALENGKAVDHIFFEKTIDFIRNYADKFHHAKEEEILFKELCKETTEMHCNPTTQMLYEHDLGRTFVKELEAGINEDNKNKVIENGHRYAQLIQEHIFKEDNILYPMADDALSPKIQKELEEKAKAAEAKLKIVQERCLAFAKEASKR